MRVMPIPPGTTKADHEEVSHALQRWLWSCLAAGWNPAQPESHVWSHDENQQAMSLGWMISQPPGSQHVDLFSLRPAIPACEIMDTLIRAAPVDPLAARAVAVLTAQRLKHPNVKFNFLRPNHESDEKR